jgi:hypothetical protein
LQYWLSNDNAKFGAISIQTNEELLLFKDCLRKIIVPPCLTNGKASTQTPKQVLVHFEDASSEIKETSSSSSKKVFVFFMLQVYYICPEYYHCRILWQLQL